MLCMTAKPARAALESKLSRVLPHLLLLILRINTNRMRGMERYYNYVKKERFTSKPLVIALSWIEQE